MRKKGKQTKRSGFSLHKSRLSKRLHPQFFLGLGALSIVLWGILTVHSATSLSFSSTEPLLTSDFSNQAVLPTYISIPSLSLSLPTFEATITNGIWQIHDHGVSHLSSSHNPGENGNGIFYAHNTEELFGKLHDIQKGDQIHVTTKNAEQFSYTVTDIQTVNPTDIDILTSYNTETITLYTCTGFADLKRLIVKATLNKPITSYSF